MNEIIIIPCTKEKVWDNNPGAGRIQAKDAYTKYAFRQWRKHAEESGCKWLVLSTKYGFISPETLIERYNMTASAALSDSSFMAKLREQAEDLKLSDYDRIVVLDWEMFDGIVREALPDLTEKIKLKKILY